MSKKKKKSGRFSTFLFLLLLISGLAVLLYPKISDLYVRHQLAEETGRYNQLLAEQAASVSSYDEMFEEAEEYNQYILTKDSQLVALKDEREWASTILNPLENGMIATLTIPKIGVNMPVYQGTEEAELQSGAGWWIGSSMPIGGESTHSIITAHTGLVKVSLFTDLDKLEVGDTFKIQVLNRDLYYQVDQILVVLPEETGELRVIPGEDHVTLYTCTPYGVNSHRLLVRGTRVPEEEPEVIEEFEEPNNWYYWLLPLLGLIPLFTFWLRKRKAKPVTPAASPAPAAVPAAEPPVTFKAPGLIRMIPSERRTCHTRKRVMKMADHSAGRTTYRPRTKQFYRKTSAGSLRKQPKNQRRRGQ